MGTKWRLLGGLLLALAVGMALGAGSGPRAAAQGQNVELVGQIGGPVRAVAVQGRYAYIGVGPRLVVVDVSNPAAPRKVGESGVLPETVLGVAVSGAYAYVADGGCGSSGGGRLQPGPAPGGGLL